MTPLVFLKKRVVGHTVSRRGWSCARGCLVLCAWVSPCYSFCLWWEREAQAFQSANAHSRTLMTCRKVPHVGRNQINGRKRRGSSAENEFNFVIAHQQQHHLHCQRWQENQVLCTTWDFWFHVNAKWVTVWKQFSNKMYLLPFIYFSTLFRFYDIGWLKLLHFVWQTLYGACHLNVLGRIWIRYLPTYLLEYLPTG